MSYDKDELDKLQLLAKRKASKPTLVETLQQFDEGAETRPVHGVLWKPCSLSFRISPNGEVDQRSSCYEVWTK